MAAGHGGVGVVGEQPVHAQAEEQAVLGRGVAGGAEVDRAGRIALAEVGGREAVLVVEGPRVDQQAGPIGVADHAGRLESTNPVESMIEVRRNTTVEWDKKEQVRTSLRRHIRRLLMKYTYPPDRQ
jgi:hypothetical protein